MLSLTVKCSNCSRPVPIDELGDHVCSAPPSLPKPALSPADAAFLLPPHLQGRLQDRSPRPRAATIARPPSNASAFSYNPSLRPSFDAGPSYSPGPPPRELLPPLPRASPNIELNTQSGGEAGMAGVGRRGFAAVARAAMYIPGGQPHSDNVMPYLDTDISRRTNDTPPLSAGSGNSSHSPGISPYPQSPVGHPVQPYPDRYDLKPPPSHRDLFDKNRNQLPGVVIPDAIIPGNDKGLETPSTARQHASPPRPPRKPEDSVQGVVTRSLSKASLPSARRPLSSTDSASDYGEGLAYAESTDYEDEEHPVDAKTRGKANPPPPLPLNGILRSTSTSTSTSTSSMNRIRFTSSTPQRKDSMSSLSSSGGDDTRKSNSAAIAHALGLSQAQAQVGSKSYARLGGPGAGMGGRGRSGTGTSASGSGSAHLSGDPGMGGSSIGMGTLEKELKSLMAEVGAEGGEERDRRAGLSKSKSTGRQRTFGAAESEAGGLRAPLIAKTASGTSLTREEWKEKRQELQLRDPARTKSSTEKVKKPKVCLKCNKKIEDGRWVATESGGVLCERCWKHMYLPKCRRCNLPIENAAVSSADGQLKGKYHRECFNCHVCHEPFPDKSFYVFDGKPLCKYHYHEANESLCAAALCGQPIEGPCAVSHTGDRYHPEHMLCEYPGYPPCTTKLAEYWEVEGRMLCERHAHAGGDDERGEEEWVKSSKRTKRVTRYIDLAGGLPSGGLR